MESSLAAVAAARLRAQRLAGEAFAGAAEAVRGLGAVQSQDYSGAKWALAQRTPAATEPELDRLFDEGAILRTHVMRPTWHFVLPEDAGWLLELTAPRIRAGLVARYRQLEITMDTARRAGEAFASALAGGRNLTRFELGEVLAGAGVSPTGQRLPHLLMAAELERLIISGPRRGRQFTYALFEERAPKARPLDRAEAVARLSRRYFQSHGPARLQDFAWWSGLTVADARAGVAAAGDALQRGTVEGREYWSAAGAAPVPGVAGIAHLLPNFDEYTVGYRDRTAALDPAHRFDQTLFSFGSILANIVTIAGRVRGSWRRSQGRGAVHVELRLLGALRPDEVVAVEATCRRLGRFLERPVELDGPNW